MKKDIQEHVTEDWSGTRLGFWKHGNEKQRLSFSLVISDEGGYSAINLSINEWFKVKEKVDALIREHVK